MGAVTYAPKIEKEYIRNSVFLFFKDCDNILTLPNLYFDLERQFIEDGRKQIDCCEYKPEIFKEQKLLAPPECNLFFGDVSEMDLSKYDGIFLDLCGFFSKSTDKVFKSLKPGTKIVVTFLLRRENKKLQKMIDIKNRESSYVLLLNKYDIFVTKYVNYGEWRTPMCVFFGTKY